MMQNLHHRAVINTLTLAISVCGLQSTPAQEETRGVQIVADAPEFGVPGYAKRHALVIGIDEYEDPGYPDLGHAVADARAGAKILVERFGFDEDNVQLILDTLAITLARLSRAA